VAPDGHEIRYCQWPDTPGGVERRGSMLFMPGRGDFYEKYLECFEDWRHAGWRVSAADWRGQAGSGRLGGDDLTGHIDDFALWIDDLAAFWRNWTARHEGPHVLMGHSMGGHLTLRAVAERALDPAPAGLILSAPMLDVVPEVMPLFIKRGLAGLMSRIGDSRRRAWKTNERPGHGVLGRQALLTHDDRRYADEAFWREARPEIVLGPPSWGWLDNAVRSIQYLQRDGLLEAVDIPVLLMGAQADPLVGFSAIRRAAERIPDCESLFFGPESRHEFLRETDDVRDRALAAIGQFLDRVSR
jgi:lysophospholipase